jgi:enoyl-CoA hydratase/carnithine racemase
VAYGYDLVEVTIDGNIGLLQFNQPERLNPVNPQNSEVQIRDALRELEVDTAVRAVVMTGKGRAFSAGADIRGGVPLHPGVETMEGRGSWVGGFLYGSVFGGPAIAEGRLWSYIHRFRKPLIGAVNGYALGGGWELAQACDVVVANESAQFGAIEIKLGLFPFGIGSQYLARTVGKHRALELMMTGEMIGAQRALEWGLVNKVVPDDQLMDAAMELAHLIVSHAPLALGVIKYMTNKALALEDHYDLERALAGHLGTTEDTRASREAWVSRQPFPPFKNR